MKKVLAILLALSVLALSACAAKQANSDTQKDSNTVETEQQPDSAQTAETQQPAQEAKRIEPLAESLDLNALTDATVAASFGAEDISEKDGKMEITLTVYDYDVYDMVDVAQLAVGDTIVVKPGERVPLDGTVLTGTSALNMSALTGESAPVDVTEGSTVVSGSVNLSGVLRLRVEKVYAESKAGIYERKP